MKYFLNTFFIVLIFLSLIPIVSSCKKHEVPTLTTATVTNITGTTATSGGTITDEGSGTIVERGICWSKGITPITADNRTIEGGGAGTFISNMSDLDGATTYYVRAYATNEAGTGYGMAMSFTTLGQAPTATTQSATNVTTNTATLNGIANANYLSTTITFEYGTTTSYGQIITATQSPVTGNSNTNVTAEIIGLTAGTTYHFRIKTVNSLGTTNGNDISFTTLGQAPSAVTQSACCLSSSGAKLNGTVNANYVSTSVTFEYGLTTDYGSIVIASQSPVTGNTSTNVSANISGLDAGTTYHFRVKAVNSLGTTYGDDVIFQTLSTSTTVTDIDGNVYNIVIISTQTWMKENLKAIHYLNGDPIPNITDNTAWSNLITGAYCDLENTPSNSATYGKLYNWYTVVDLRKLCPIGWHIPTDAEWHNLVLFLDANAVLTSIIESAIAGGKLKEIGTNTWPPLGTHHWYSPNTGATDEVGFTALPSGYRNFTGEFSEIGYQTEWWSSIEYNITNAWKRRVDYSVSDIYRINDNKKIGFSVRCVKD